MSSKYYSIDSRESLCPQSTHCAGEMDHDVIGKSLDPDLPEPPTDAHVHIIVAVA